MVNRTISWAFLALWMFAASASAAIAPAGYWTRLRAATGIREGRGPIALVVFFDPNCPFCHLLYEHTQPLLKGAACAIEWIPVGVLTESSYGKAAALLRARNPQAALAMNEKGFRQGTDGAIGPQAGGAILPRRAPPAIQKALATNKRLLAEGDALGVPFVVYRKPDGKVHTINGNPPQAQLRRLWAACTAKTKPQKAGS